MNNFPFQIVSQKITKIESIDTSFIATKNNIDNVHFFDDMNGRGKVLTNSDQLQWLKYKNLEKRITIVEEPEREIIIPILKQQSDQR